LRTSSGRERGGVSALGKENQPGRGAKGESDPINSMGKKKKAPAIGKKKRLPSFRRKGGKKKAAVS